MNIDEKMKDTLWQLATTLRDNAAKKYDATDARYRQLVEAACEVDKEYMGMYFSHEQRACVERMCDCRLEVSEYQLTMIYLAGLLDGIDFLRQGGFLDLYIMDRSYDKKAETEAEKQERCI